MNNQQKGASLITESYMELFYLPQLFLKNQQGYNMSISYITICKSESMRFWLSAISKLNMENILILLANTKIRPHDNSAFVDSHSDT